VASGHGLLVVEEVRGAVESIDGGGFLASDRHVTDFIDVEAELLMV
jgi:hypothetical protein